MKILMIGNSGTYCNDMPKILEKLIRENGTEIRVDSVTKGGRQLVQNLDPADEKHREIAELTAENRYDVLILQEHTVYSFLEEERFAFAVAGLMKTVSAPRTLLYSTAPRKEGHAELAEHGWTSADMAFAVYGAYKRVATQCGAELSPSTMCFYWLSQIHAELNLYAADNAHPSYLGSCVAALTHYQKIFCKLPASHAALRIGEDDYRKIAEAVEVLIG